MPEDQVDGEESYPNIGAADRDVVLASLRAIGEQIDDEIDVAEAALLLAALDRRGESLDPYRDILAEIAAEARRTTARTHSVEMQIAALTDLLAARWKFRGDSETYDDPRNANLIDVVERRRGLPVAIGILWLHAGRAYGADITGLAFPSHFLLRLSARGQRVIIDPFHGGKLLGAEDLRRMIKDAHGGEKEIEPGHYAPVGNRDVLIRLQNNLKLRAIAADNFERALEILVSMTAIAPRRSELWWETAVLHSRLGNMKTAIAVLEAYLADSSGDHRRAEIEDLLRRLRARVN
ncbi:MAG: transglutaminase family protein [Rhodospirillales bacterium]|nr:transglutaminase family protein [Rhodospirillales bacterium]